MKRNKQNPRCCYRLFAVCLAGCLSVVPACSIRKRHRTEQTANFRSDILSKDSLLFHQRKEYTGQLLQYSQQVRLSMPDSSGRQYPEDITTTLTAYRQTGLTADTLHTQSVASTHMQQKDSSLETRATILRPFPIGLAGGIFCLLLLILLFIKRWKKT